MTFSDVERLAYQGIACGACTSARERTILAALKLASASAAVRVNDDRFDLALDEQARHLAEQHEAARCTLFYNVNVMEGTR